ncbi:hypothetical protein DFQ30_003760 [Apophysomyces sp. BC1015]|nr:hypothetical protein DFQ30_003760 [Apophysomyces sp. BC1015]
MEFSLKSLTDPQQQQQQQQRTGVIALPGDSHLSIDDSVSISTGSDYGHGQADSAQFLRTKSARRCRCSARWRIKAWDFWHRWRWAICIAIFSLVMWIVLWIYRKEMLRALETLSKAVKNMGFGGYLLMSGLIFLSAFPPMIGYGTYQTLSGFSFGFVRGFVVSYFSALLGAIGCFLLARIWLKAYVQRFMESYPSLKAVVKAVEKKGFKATVCSHTAFSLSIWPFATDISLIHYALGTAISLIKIGLHVYIGANMTSFAKHVLGEDDDMTEGERQAENVRYVAIGIGSFLALGVMAYVYLVAKRAVAEVAAETESEEAMAFLGPSAEEEEEEQRIQ